MRANTMEQLGLAIRVARTAVRLRMVDLAERIGVHEATVSRWETGETEMPATHLPQIAEVCDTTVCSLLGIPCAQGPEERDELRSALLRVGRAIRDMIAESQEEREAEG